MLNLAQVTPQVKAANFNGCPLNTATPAAASQAYKLIKRLGWACGDGSDNIHAMELHPTDRVPVFRLYHAALRRNKRTGGWIIDEGDGHERSLPRLSAAELERLTEDIGAERIRRTTTPPGRKPGHTYDVVPGDGGVSDQDLEGPLDPEYERMLAQEMARRERHARETALPASVDQVDSIEDWLGYESTPRCRQTADEELETYLADLVADAPAQPEPAQSPLSTAQEVAIELERQHGALGGRIDRALALVEAGTVEFPHYNTRVDEATGVSYCDCPDRAPWVSSGNTIGILTYFNGKGCKHALARNIAYQVKHQAESVAYRKHADKAERRRDRQTRPQGTVADQIAEARAGLDGALASQQPKSRIGSLPTDWQYR